MHTLQFDPPIIAHRGASDYAPENTLAAFKQAKRLGINWVEFDVMLAACGEAVVIHDESLGRTTNGEGLVCDLPYAKIQLLDAGSWFDPKFKNERAPTLKQVIALLNRQQLNANIEIKSQSGHEQQVVEKVLSDIGQYWQVDKPAPLISSFSLTILQWVRKLAPEALIGFLMDEWQNNWQVACNQLQCASVNINQALVTPERIQQIKSQAYQVLCYTVNDKQRAAHLFDLNVDAIFSDAIFSS